MSISRVEGMTKWEEFINRWPLEKLSQITLQEYSHAGSNDSFTYWLEAVTEKLGSIWGGSSFKFGVYSRDDLTEKIGGSGRSYNDKYAWYSKYGDTAEKAFKNVLQEILNVAAAARNGDLTIVDTANLERSL